MDGFSADGYITDQDFFGEYTYRRMSSDINGCGWIAAYNLRHAMGQEVDFDDVRREMDAMIRLQIPGPTPMRVLRAYLRRYVPCRYAAGKAAARRAGETAAAGILRYWEGQTPHFIAFVRVEGTRHRFFNVTDGQEDITEDFGVFFQNHCRRGFVRILTAEKGRNA